MILYLEFTDDLSFQEKKNCLKIFFLVPQIIKKTIKNKNYIFFMGQLILNPKCYQVSKPEMELHMINIIYMALPMRAQRKDDIFMHR